MYLFDEGFALVDISTQQDNNQLICLLCLQDGSSAHEVLDFLPTIPCITPEEALRKYGQGIPEGLFIHSLTFMSYV